MNQQSDIAGRSVTLTERAAKRIAALRVKEGRPDAKFRVWVSGGGCSGFQYGFDFDDAQSADDHTIEQDGVTVLIDEVSLQYLMGSQIDFTEDLIGAAFQINNPNATASCGCGTSFSI